MPAPDLVLISGRDAPPRSEAPPDTERVFEAWRARQKLPSACRFTTARRRLIASALREGYTVEDLLLVLRWAYDSEDRAAKWLRGEVPENRRPYLDLENLFRISKVAARVECAAEWEAAQQGKLQRGSEGLAYRVVYPGDEPRR